MGEMVASISVQVLDDLRVKDEYMWTLIKDEIEKSVLVLQRIGKLLSNHGNSEQVIKNIRKIKNLMYTIEDVLESWVVGVEKTFIPSNNENKRGIITRLKRYFGTRHEGSDVSNVMCTFIPKSSFEARPLINWFNDTFPEDFESEIDLRSSSKDLHLHKYPHQDIEDYFVVIETHCNNLVELITNQDEKDQVVCIWGAMGLEKTTLARRVYIDHKIQREFKACASVSLSQDYQIGYLLRNILYQLEARAPTRIKEKKKTTILQIDEHPENSEENVMEHLKEILRNNRCFIVFNGISSSQWNTISSQLQLMEDAQTRFLLITENQEIPGVSGVGFPDKLMSLYEDKGWEMFRRYAFHGKEEPPDLGLMPKLGKEIVRKCEGEPSKISTLGRILGRSSLREWHVANVDVNGYLHKVADQRKSNERSNVVVPSSYYSLSYEERQCFLYYSAIVKEDEGVNQEDLSFLWMAEGMVSPQKLGKGKNLMDTDQQPVKSTIMEATEDYLRKFPSNYDYAWGLSLQLREEEDFRLEVLSFSDGIKLKFGRYTLYVNKTRRLVIHFNKHSSPKEQENVDATDDLRSILFLNSDREYVNLPVKISDFSKFILLRILHFVRCKFEGRNLPKGILELLNLRYLGILYCDLESLPSDINKVKNLQVLNVRAYIPITIPDKLFQMVSLKHLRVPHNLDYEISPPNKLDIKKSKKKKLNGSSKDHETSDDEQSKKLKLNGLSNLETLDGFNADKHDIHSLVELKNLQHLVIYADSNDTLKSIIEFVKSDGAQGIQTNLVIESKCDLTSREGVHFLEEVLMCPNLVALTFSMVVIDEFPNCGEFAFKELTEIKLTGCKLSKDPMKELGKFDNLRKMCLDYGAFVGTVMDIHNGDFPNLEYLEFRCLPYLERWTMGKGAMIKLCTLIVGKCPELKGIPNELEFVKVLKTMDIELPPNALDKKQKETYAKKFAFVKSYNIRPLS